MDLESCLPRTRFLLAGILLTRLAIALALFGLVFGLLWWDRDGLPDQRDGKVSFTDVVYFTTITVTTVSYGDIVPVSIRARLLDALVVTTKCTSRCTLIPIPDDRSEAEPLAK